MLTVRPAEISDAPLVALLGRITFAETFGDLFAGYEQDLAAYLAETFAPAKIARSMAKPDNHYWLARLDDLPIGYAKLKSRSGHPQVPGDAVGQLQKIYVLRDFLSAGAGKAMSEALLAEARARHCDQLWLTVLDSNAPAIGFYERQGWLRRAKDTHQIGARQFVYDVLALPLG